MKNKFIAVVLLFTFSVFLGCEKEETTEKETLYVKFINSSASEYTIYSIQLRARGSAANHTTPTENWGANILQNGKTLAPGAHEFFTLEIPNLEWSEYRVGVIDNGNNLMLHEQVGFSSNYECPITHWGSDERTVEVTVKKDIFTGLINYSGYSDFAGIEN